MPVVRSTKPVPARPRPRRRRLLIFLVILAIIAVAVGIFVIRPFWGLSGQFNEITFRQPSRLYGRATRLSEGRNYPPELLIANLSGEGYREDDSSP